MILKLINLACLLSLLIISYVQNNNHYKYLFILPLGVLILNFLFQKQLNRLKNSVVFHLILFQLIIRYIILPPYISAGEWTLAGFDSQSGTEATIFMMLELLFIYIAFGLISIRQFNSFLMKQNDLLLIKRSIILTGSLTFILFYLIYTNYLIKVNFIWNLQYYIDQVTGETVQIQSDSLAGLLFPLFKILISLLVISFVISKKNLNIKLKISFLLLVILINTLLIVGMSRFSLILTALPLLIICIITFYEHKRKLILGSLVILVPIILITSIIKFSRGDQEAKLNSIINANSLNSYFAGIGNVSVGVDSYNDLAIHKNTLFLANDLFQNVPLISKATDEQYKSNFYFNKKIYKHQLFQIQIVPLTTAGLYHFGVFGVFIYPFIFSLLSFYFERKFLQTRYIGIKYAYISLAVCLSLIWMLNIGSMMSTIIKTIFFIYLPFLMIHKLQNNRRV